MVRKGSGRIDLGMTQIFRMGATNLDKRFNDFFNATKDATYVIQCAIAVMVRNGLSCGDFSTVGKDLIRDLYLTNDQVRSMPLTCIYFRDFFTSEEWETVKSRLFANEDEFQQVTKSTSTYLEHLRPKLNSGAHEVERRTSMISYFKDGAGKRHSWSLSNVNPEITKEEHYQLLSILSTLDIFKKDGVRRFAEPIYADFMIYHSGFDTRKEEEVNFLQQLPGRLLPVRTQAASVQEEATATSEEANPTIPSQQAAAQTETGEPTAPQQSATAPAAENAADMEAYLLEGFDRSSVSEEELAKLAMVAVLQGKQIKDVVGLAHLVEYNAGEESEMEGEEEELFNLTDLLTSNPVSDATAEAEDQASEETANKSSRKLSRKESQQRLQQYNLKKKAKSRRKKRK
ncbi:hypothetical protein I588_02020 [Enterococcus pallens ATCC BAA-351]|uniref:Uncharacterized protein n=2 Tax=Enterococcus pallens TaxID=160454 RepID=R2QQC1_9ENTE|nr:hypothetical protein UAU_00076 [Enterococcus pallens ATCC BAA-351]EOU21173.1 hypothetical protein I588_02020 [Enterococcus pallens ATCC BAA-351]